MYSNIQLLKKFSPPAGFRPSHSLTPPAKNPAGAHACNGLAETCYGALEIVWSATTFLLIIQMYFNSFLTLCWIPVSQKYDTINLKNACKTWRIGSLICHPEPNRKLTKNKPRSMRSPLQSNNPWRQSGGHQESVDRGGKDLWNRFISAPRGKEWRSNGWWEWWGWKNIIEWKK